MKQLFCLSVMTLFSVTTLFSQEITFSMTRYNFGTVQETDGTMSYDFQFTNTGDKPLVIKEVITGCGCTSAKWSEKPYQPGAKGTIRISYHPENRKQKVISIVSEVFSNAKEVVPLTVTGNIVLAKHSYVNFYNPDNGKRKTPTVTDAKDDFERILQRIREQIYSVTTVEKIDKGVTGLLKQMTPQATWADIDYNCYFRTNWDPRLHLNRVKQIATAYTCPQSTLYGNDVLYQAICKAMKVWVNKNPQSFNWWHNDISAPKAMADILALMAGGEKKLPDDIAAGMMKLMGKSDPHEKTGANKMDIAAHHLIRGCYLKNDSIVAVNASELLQPVCITDGEGIRADMSYQQHGAQLYIGGYGSVFVENITSVARLLAGTKYGMDKEKLKLFSEFVRGTYLNTFRGRFMDYSVCGRSISRKGTLAPSNLEDLFKNLRELDPSNTAEYMSTAKHVPRNQMFYYSDYMLHNRSRFDFSVRTSSVRTKRCESGNGENLWGTYLSDGATDIRVIGNEYADIFPVWEWDKIPGTTAPAGEVENKNDWGKIGTSTFSGGVSDGKYGVIAYVLNDYGVSAKKAWFMTDDRVVCLGTDISSDSDKEIHTAINQCRLDGDVYAQNGTLSKLVIQGKASVSKGWIWHNKVGYYFPEESAGVLKAGTQTGKWSKINFNQPSDEVSMPVFNFVVSHGINPSSATYSYVVAPGINNPQILSTFAIDDVKIESNTSDIQAISCKSRDMVQAVFYTPSTLVCNGKKITASVPCVALIKGISTANPDILTTDPTKAVPAELNNGVVKVE